MPSVWHPALTISHLDEIRPRGISSGRHSVQITLSRWFRVALYVIRMTYYIEHKSSERLTMMTSSNGNIFRVTGPLCGEFTGPGEFPTQRPVTRSFDVFFDMRLNKRLSKQPWGWWFETLSWSLWRHCNAETSLPRLLNTSYIALIIFTARALFSFVVVR